MNSAAALLAAAEAQDKAAAHSRVGLHTQHSVAFEGDERVPFLSLEDVMRDICKHEGEPMHGPSYELACRAVVEILRVIIGDTTKDSSRELSRAVVANRAIALAWTVSPALFDGSPSLRELARRYGVTAPALALYTGELRDRFGVSNYAQRMHDHSRMKLNAAKPNVVIAKQFAREPLKNGESRN